MDNEFYSIVEKLAILEGRITPSDNKSLPEAKQKKPALFTNLKKKEESAMPMVGGVEFAEDKVEEDTLTKVKNSLVDYLKSAEEELKQDSDLIKQKKQDLDLKKKELKDLDLQQKKQEEEVEEAIPDTLEEDKLQAGDPIIVTAPNEYEGMTGEILEFSPSGKFVVVTLYNGPECSMHVSDVEYNQYADDEDMEDEERMMDEDPNQTPSQGEAPAGLSSPTYAESAPVKTMNVPTEEVGLSGGGGSVLVELHGDERDGFCIKRAGKELPTRFKTLEEAELALEMFMAHRKARHAAEQSADYIEEK